jgi:hypothetical protein
MVSAGADENKEALSAIPPRSSYLPLSSSSVVNPHRGGPEPPRGSHVGNCRPSGSVIWASKESSQSLVLHLHRGRSRFLHGSPVVNFPLSRGTAPLSHRLLVL